MSALTDYYENAIIEHSFDGSSMPSAPSSVYIALHSGDPSESGDANELNSSTTSYERQQVSTSGGFDVSGNQASNANNITFPLAEEDWGTVSHFSVWDGSSSTDNALWYSALDSSTTISNGDELRFNAGALTLEID